MKNKTFVSIFGFDTQKKSNLNLNKLNAYSSDPDVSLAKAASVVVTALPSSIPIVVPEEDGCGINSFPVKEDSAVVMVPPVSTNDGSTGLSVYV